MLQNRDCEQFVALTNTIKAVGILADKLTDQQRRELRSLLHWLAEEHGEPRVRVEASKVLQKQSAPTSVFVGNGLGAIPSLRRCGTPKNALPTGPERHRGRSLRQFVG